MLDSKSWNKSAGFGILNETLVISRKKKHKMQFSSPKFLKFFTNISGLYLEESTSTHSMVILRSKLRCDASLIEVDHKWKTYKLNFHLMCQFSEKNHLISIFAPSLPKNFFAVFTFTPFPRTTFGVPSRDILGSFGSYKEHKFCAQVPVVFNLENGWCCCFSLNFLYFWVARHKQLEKML